MDIVPLVFLPALPSLTFVLASALAPPAAVPAPDPAATPEEVMVPNESRPIEGPTAVPAIDSDREPATAITPTADPAAGPITGSSEAPDDDDDASSDSSSKPRGLVRHRFVYKNLTALRYNPLGLVNEFTFGYRLQLVNKNTTLFKDSFVALKAHTFVNPAFGRVGPMLEIQPLALLNLHVIYNAVGYFKTFDQQQTFQSPAVKYSDSENEKTTDRRYPGTGHMVTASALFQVKVGRVAVRDNVKFYWTSFDMKKDPQSGRADTVYYDQTLDILQPNKGWVATNDLDALYLFDFGLKLGARYTLTHAFYKDSMYLPGESTKNLNNTQRVGPAILYAPPKWRAKAAKRHGHSRKRWYNPTAFLLAQWWVQHRWRTGEDVSAGVPYILLGFSFEGDFHP